MKYALLLTLLLGACGTDIHVTGGTKNTLAISYEESVCEDHDGIDAENTDLGYIRCADGTEFIQVK